MGCGFIAIGVFFWVMHNLLTYLGYAAIGIGGVTALLWLVRFSLPIVEKRVYVKSEHHRMRLELADAELKLRMMDYAERTRAHIEMSGMKVTQVLPYTSVTEVDAEEPKYLPSPKSPDNLELSSEFQPHADTILSGRVTIFGVSGSGKSNTFATLIEELGRLEVPLLIADTEDEYGSLASPTYLPNPQVVDANTVNVMNAEEFGYYLLDARIQALLNLTAYSNDEAAQVLTNMIGGMWAWEEQVPVSERISCMVMLDEAAKWLPQLKSESCLSTEVQNALFNCISTGVVSRGRKRGIGFTLANQRIATLNKNVLQPNVQILHRQSQDVDIKRYGAMGISNDEVATLRNGEAYIFTDTIAKLRTRIRKRRSPHGADTPGLASLRNGTRGNAVWNDGSQFHGYNPPTEPFQNISTFPSFPNGSALKAVREVPEIWKSRIRQKLDEGLTRTEVRDALGLSGDQYWMVKEVANEYDKAKQA